MRWSVGTIIALLISATCAGAVTLTTEERLQFIDNCATAQVRRGASEAVVWTYCGCLADRLMPIVTKDEADLMARAGSGGPRVPSDILQKIQSTAKACLNQ
jgi:Fe-S oxidoreductase